MRWVIFFVACLFMQSTANAAWHRAESQNFIVYMDGRERDVIRFTQTLERFNHVMAGLARVAQEQDPVKLRVFAVEHASTVQSFYNETRIDLGGFYRPLARGPFTVLTEPQRFRGRYSPSAYSVLFHEYAHHFMMQYFPANYPGWYVEGYAEFYGQIQFESDSRIRIGAVPPGHGPLLHRQEWIPTADMLSNRADLSPMLYAQAWLFFHYTFFDDDARELLTRYLMAMQQGASAGDAYSDTFGATGADYDEVLQRYRDRGAVSGTLTLTDIPDFPMAIDRISNAEAEVALLYPTDSVDGLALAEETARENPEVANAYVELARLRLEDGNISGALEAANRAIELEPENLEANLYKGMVLTEMALDAQSDDSPYWTEARDYIARANRIFPNNALALLSFYRAYPDDRQRPEIADRALERALELVPQSYEIRGAIINELINQRRYDEARQAIVPLMQSPHGVDNSGAARSMMDELDRLIEQRRDGDQLDSGRVE
ncbi:MAG: tetratricopeptide repeat protein [Parasphingopyxis sp.]|uniref:tetratricopeptide repeat protein n=1 Tax=Parasphingopyxis sp. TaxID=1920299 RepID=UPI003F9F40B5